MSDKIYVGLFTMRNLTLVMLCCAYISASPQNAYGQESVSTISIITQHSRYGGGRIYVPARIDNYKGYMRFDTGASSSRFYKSAWNKKFISRGISHSISATSAITKCDEIVIPNLSIVAQSGNAIGRINYLATRCAASSGDNLLGLDFLKGSEFTVNLKDSELRFFEPTGNDSKTHLLRALGRNKELIGIDLDIGGLSTYGLLDTGAEMTAVDSVYFNAHPELFETVQNKISLRGANGKVIASSLCKIKLINLGNGFIIKNLYALVYDFSLLKDEIGHNTPVILGYNFFEKFKWKFNFKKNITPTWSVYNY